MLPVVIRREFFVMRMCTVANCNRVHIARGYCIMHYQQERCKGALRKKDLVNSGKLCAIESCHMPAKSTGLCIHHYERKRMYGHPLGKRQKKTGQPCSVPKCDGKTVAKGLCLKHYARVKRHGSADGFSDWFKQRDEKKLDRNGYVLVYDPQHPNKKKGGRVLEHRKIMSDYLGRKLERHENVHHKNGDKTDNELRNLELWSSSQPSGQRVTDKAKWCIEFLSSETICAVLKIEPELGEELARLRMRLKPR
jgi:hypothetical protein